jgi:hypothetical protein
MENWSFGKRRLHVLERRPPRVSGAGGCISHAMRPDPERTLTGRPDLRRSLQVGMARKNNTGAKEVCLPNLLADGLQGIAEALAEGGADSLVMR